MRIDRALLRGLALLSAFVAASAAPAQVGGPPPPAPQAAAPEAPPPQRRARLRSEIRPYLEVDQVVSAALDGDGDVLTYTALAAGVDGRVVTRRVTAQMSYRYERRFAWDGDLGDEDVHSGIAAVHAQIVPGLLDFDAGALATRTAGEGRALGVTDRDAAIEVYSVYAGPTLSAQAGPLAVNASYRLGYVAIDDDTFLGTAPFAEEFDDAVAHSATASVGMAPGPLPVGWTVGAGYAREESGEFDHVYEGAYVRGDVVVPLSPSFALTGGVGYETIEASQLDFATDAGGAPVVGPDGFLVPDPAKPRLLTLDIDGIIYDGGFIWRPSARTEVEARAGHRYGGTTIVASVEHRFNRSWGLSASIYDGVETFGRLLISDLNRLPGEFDISSNPLTGDLGLGGCVFGADPGSGVCLDRALQSITGATFRHRGASLLLSGSQGPWDLGAGAGYSRRRFFLPDSALLPEIERVDESVTLFASAGRALSRSSAVDFDVYASWFDSDRAAFDDTFGAGFTASYRRRFLLDRLQFLAALGLYHTDGGALDSTVASALLGLRYTF